MKILLSLVICSGAAGACLDPFPWAETFDTNYECLKFGYEESLRKLAEIGPDDVNKFNMYIKFGCYPEVAQQEGAPASYQIP